MNHIPVPRTTGCAIGRRPLRLYVFRLLPALCALLALSACATQIGTPAGPSLPGQAAGIPDSTAVVSVDGAALPAWRVLYWLTLACDRIREENAAPDWSAQVENADSASGVNGKTLSDYAKEQAVANALLYAETEAMAARYGVTLDAADQSALEAQWADRCASHGGEAAYLRLLERFGLDREKSMELYRTGRLYGKLCALCREGGGPQPDDLQYAALERNSRQIRFDRILASSADGRTKAAAYFVRLNGAEDQETLFAELAAQGDDRLGPRTLTDGSLDGKLAEAVRALEIGQLSGIVESDEGFSILRRLPPERGPLLDAWLDRTLEEAVSTARTEVSGPWRALDAGAFASRLEELRAGM